MGSKIDLALLFFAIAMAVYGLYECNDPRWIVAYSAFIIYKVTKKD